MGAWILSLCFTSSSRTLNLVPEKRKTAPAHWAGHHCALAALLAPISIPSWLLRSLKRAKLVPTAVSSPWVALALVVLQLASPKQSNTSSSSNRLADNLRVHCYKFIVYLAQFRPNLPPLFCPLPPLAQP